MSTDRYTPPGDWFPGVKQIGQAHIALGDSPETTIVWHWCETNDRWEGARITNHTIVSREPLTITASLACDSCMWHGFITDGQWVPA